MLSGGARCRQTARHLATSRVTFLVLRAPAARSPARLQRSPACGPEAVTLQPSSPAGRRGTRGSRPTHRAQRTGPWGLAAALARTGARADGLAHSAALASVSRVQGLRRGPLRSGATLRGFGVEAKVGTAVGEEGLNGRVVSLGTLFETELTPPATPPQFPQWVRALGGGFPRGERLVNCKYAAGAQAVGDLDHRCLLCSQA